MTHYFLRQLKPINKYYKTKDSDQMKDPLQVLIKLHTTANKRAIIRKTISTGS